jgi:uncharacterized protein YdaU (DUF1376 family)
MNDLVDHLATTAASTIVAAMATDLWRQVRRRVGRLFGRDDRTRDDRTQRQLEEARQRVGAATGTERAEIARDIESEWRGTLRHLLATEPGLADEVRRFLDDFAAAVAREADHSGARQVVVVRDNASAHIAGRDQFHVTIPWPKDRR